MQRTQKAVAIDQIKPHPRNARTHAKKQLRQIADSIRAFGFTNPILIDENDVILAGHARWEAAKILGLTTVPVIVINGLSEPKKRALLLADNRIAQNAGWDWEGLASELENLPELLALEDLNLSITGFEPAEIDKLLTDFEDATSDPGDELDPLQFAGPDVSHTCDLWRLGKHHLLCGDARNSEHLRHLLSDQSAHMAFLDPPYNVAVKSIGGRGNVKHPEFAMASGEMDSEAFTIFLIEALTAAASQSVNGAVHYVCMDWRHIVELIVAGRSAYGDMLNLVTWVKSNAGQGSFYRSQHELIGVFRVGSSPHLNTVELGRHGRSRSNVWRYPGANTFRTGRMEDLRAHPTVKPVAMIADAIKDCTRRNDIILDTFCGSGTTLLAAERVGRRACGIEIDARYVDVAIRRWELFTGRDAILESTGQTFEEVQSERTVLKSEISPEKKSADA